MIVKLPVIPPSVEGTVRGYLRSLSMALERTLISTMGKDETHEKVLLMSPGKKIFAITVDDSGVITATLVQE